MSIGTRCIAGLLLATSVAVGAAQTDNASSTVMAATPPDQTMDLSQVITLLQQQQRDLARQQQELARQQKLLAAQAQQITSLKNELDVLRAPEPPAVDQALATTGPPTEADTAIDDRAGADAATETGTTIAKSTTPDQPKTRREKEAETGESVAQAQVDDPTKALLSEFEGAWRLPGTNAALRIGGFVKTDIVYNFDPLEIPDRFIVGSIPVGVSNTGIEAQSSITASQSRLNFDLREPTEFGILRAFIEGDFAGNGDTFRLRHAFGQWHRVLAGKTWSAFMDTDASPEEVDFEGLNGRINVRQAQVRLMPERGKEYGLELSMEDPNPQVQNGQGVTRAPDVVVAGRFNPSDSLHLKLGLIGRQIRAQVNPGFGVGVSKEWAWGLTVSGRRVTPMFDKRDNLIFQFNQGNGIGRYVNDLSSIGNYDGIIDPRNGNLQLFDVFSGYLSWQHWWGGPKNLRSNYIFGFVDVNNPGFVEGDAYKRTFRLSANLLWSPTPRIDMGAEYLWGRRENEDGEHGDATQFQLMARYRF
jgi:hypothetical protein